MVTNKLLGMPTVGLLRLGHNALSRFIFAEVIAAGFSDLRPAHGNLLEHLSYDDGMRLTDLAARAGMTAQSMGELVDDLERRGYVERRPDPNDRRARRIFLTERGKAADSIAYRAVLETERRIRVLLGAERYQQLRQSIETIVSAEQP